MAEALDSENCLEVWSLAERLHRVRLQERAETFLLSNFQAVLRCPKEQLLLCPPHLFREAMLSPKLRLYGPDGGLLWQRARRKELEHWAGAWEAVWPNEVLVELPPRDQEPVQEYVVCLSGSIGHPMTGMGLEGDQQFTSESFQWQREASIRAVTLAWRRTNKSPVLVGLAFHWSDDGVDRVGEQEEQEELELERQELDVGEHFTLVIGADSRCIEQLNFVTSRGRVLGPMLRPRASSSLVDLLPDLHTGDLTLAGLKGHLYTSPLGLNVLGQLRFVYRVFAPPGVPAALPSLPDAHYRSPNFLTFHPDQVSDAYSHWKQHLISSPV